MDRYTAIIALANTTTLVVGGLIVLLAYRAFRRTGSSPLRAVAVGFGFIVTGSLLGGLVHLIGENVALGIAVQSSFTAGGFVVLWYSLYTSGSTATTIRRSTG
ncbi:hypothetical protein ACFOZ7_21880 [Natribaculum luteum]|uniref:Uncharacterized protein n=1 Tax=Natribaculum luteum TaxID=1586232 RepID=A0ABD5P5G5_9EURY|nr:hypothetical protein [Natribaculum luteum]